LSPSALALYLYGIALTFISQNGNLSGTYKNDICLGPDELMVPVGFAKYLQGLAPYSDGEATFRSFAVLDTQPAVSVSNFGPNINSFGIDISALNLPNEEFCTVAPLIVPPADPIGEYSMASAAFSAVLPTLWGPLADGLSQAIAASGLSCIAYKNIPKQAPNASAYAMCVESQQNNASTPALPSSLTAMWACGSVNFDSEEALLYRSFSTATDIPLQPVRKPIVNPPPRWTYDLTYPTIVPNRFSIAHYFNAWMGSRQAAYRPGRILGGAYKLCDLPIDTFAFTYQVLDWRGIFQLALVQATQYLTNLQVLPSTTEMSRLAYLYYHVLLHLVQYKINQSSPKHYLSGLGGPTLALSDQIRNPQSAFVSPVWLSAPISAAFQRYVQGIGPVNVKGTLVIPIYQLPASDGAGSPYYSTASIYPKFSVGQLGGPLTVPPGFGNDGLTWTLAPVPAWSTNGTVIGPTELGLYYLPFLAHRRMLFLNNQSKYLLTQWNLLHKKFSQGELVTKCFVHAHNAACGTVSAMLSKVAVVPGDTSNAFPPAEISITVSGFWASSEVEGVGSTVDLSASEIVEAVAFMFASGNTTGTATRRLRVNGPNATTNTLNNFCEMTFTSGAAFGNALAEREAKFDPVVATIAGNEFIPPESTEGCWVRNLIRRSASILYPALVAGAATGAGIVCNIALPGSGGVCATGVKDGMDTLKSYIGIEAADHPPPKQEDFAKVKKIFGESAPEKSKKKKSIQMVGRKKVMSKRQPPAVAAARKAKPVQRKKKNIA